MGVKDIIRKLDIFGKPVQLRLEKKKTHKTVCGGIMTILNVICLSVITFYFSEKLIYNQDPSVDTIRTVNTNQSLLQYNLGFAINILNVQNTINKTNHNSKNNNNNNNNSINNNSNNSNGMNKMTYSIHDYIFSSESNSLLHKGFNVNAYYTIRDTTDQQQTIQQNIEIPLIPCSENSRYLAEWQELFNLPEHRSNEFLCPQLDVFAQREIEMMGDTISKDAKGIQIIISIDQSFVASQTQQGLNDWQQQLDDSLVVVKLFDQIAQLEDYNQPVKQMCRTVTEWINLDVTKNIEVIYQSEVIKTDKGLYFYNFYDEQLVKIQDVHYSQQRKVQYDFQIMTFFSSVSQIETTYLRSYFKATVALAYIGGCLQLTLLFGKIITKPFAKLSFYTSFVNEVFQFEDDDNKPPPPNEDTNQTQNNTGVAAAAVINTTTTGANLMAMNDEGNNRSINQSQSSPYLPQRSIFYQNQTKGSVDLTTVDVNQTCLNETQIMNNTSKGRKSILTRPSQLNFRQTDDESQIKKVQISDSKKNSINVASPFISELNTPVSIKKKSLYKNQTLLANFRQYFEADRLEKKLIIDLKSLIQEFCWKVWYVVTYFCSKRFVQQYRHSTLQKLNFSKKKVNERLDIIYIVQKLQEIDKLKQIVLNKNQRKLFEYLPRPVLRNDTIFSKLMKTKSSATKSSLKSSEWSILKQDESIQQKAIKAWIAFIDITNKETLDNNDKKVIKLLDIKAKNIFEITSKKISDEIQEQVNLQSAKIKLQTCNSQYTAMNESLNTSKMNYPSLQRKSSSFYQFSIHGSNKRNSQKVQKQKKLSIVRFPYQDLANQDNQDNIDTPDAANQNITSLNNLESISKQDCNDDKIQTNKAQQKQAISISYQSSHSSSDSSFSSSNSSSSKSSDNSEFTYQPDMNKSRFSNSHSKQQQQQQLQINKLKESQQISSQNDTSKQTILKIQLNEIPENIEKSPQQSQEHDSSILKNSLNKDSPPSFLQNFPIKQCQELNIYLDDIVCSQNSPRNRKKKEGDNYNLIRESKTVKNSDNFLSSNLKYFDEVKNQDRIVQNKANNQSIKQNSLTQLGNNNINYDRMKKRNSEINFKNSQFIEKLAPITPVYNLPVDCQDNKEQHDISHKKFMENIILSRRKNHLLMNQKINTPMTMTKKKKNVQQDDIYNSLSFTQFLKKITPLIIENTASQQIIQQQNQGQ